MAVPAGKDKAAQGSLDTLAGSLEGRWIGHAALGARERTLRRLLHGGWMAALLLGVALCVVDLRTPALVLLADLGARIVDGPGAGHVPGAVAWNVFGFLLPGLCAAVFALALERPMRDAGARRGGRIGSTLLLLFGLLFAAQGVFSYDPSAPDDIASQTHVVLLSLGVFAFLPAAVLIPASVWRAPPWRRLGLLGTPLLVCALSCVLLPAATFGISAAALQRVLLLCEFGWIALASVVALRASAVVKLGSPH